MKTLITGATGLMGALFLEKLAKNHPSAEISCLIRPTSNCSSLNTLNLKLNYLTGDSAKSETWRHILSEETFDTIFHLVQLRHVPTILDSLQTLGQIPRLVIIGTTGVYSKYNQYSVEYKTAETRLKSYPGPYCLLRPTMIYGSYRDKNIHKLIRFCHKYGFFPVFGPGNNLLQPVHADDLAKTLLYLWENPHIAGEYDLSGGTVVSFRELLALVSQLISKPVRQISLPLKFGISMARILEAILKTRSPVKVEQILRLQEDKAYPHKAAQKDLAFYPRSLEEGLRQEVELMRKKTVI
ncbi:MAG: NAD-dependent epimerase/dehydratase family protein [Leptolyngbyaceae cyanobacterium MO_188.B28]|nr:NAD-dependent epimerase/dehydratase family protein [Leptolyngbyaceae cyanobacterium MO_188.B28]